MSVVFRITKVPKELSQQNSKLFRVLSLSMRKIMENIQNTARKKVTGDVLNVDTGRLRNSIRFRINKGGKRIVGHIGSNVVYARIHEFGGVITPKKRQFLTIPFSGVKGFAGDYSDTFIAKGIIFQKVGRGIKPLFSLKRSVTIPARPYLAPSIVENKPRAIRIIKNDISSFIQRALS